MKNTRHSLPDYFVAAVLMVAFLSISIGFFPIGIGIVIGLITAFISAALSLVVPGVVSLILTLTFLYFVSYIIVKIWRRKYKQNN